VAVDLQTLRKSHTGRRCFFLGNGPSLNKLDLSLLEGEQVWAANRAYLLFEGVSWRPAFYVIKDPNVIENSIDAIRNLMRSLPNTVFFYPDWFRSAGSITDSANVCWYREVDRVDTNYPEFSVNADEGIVRSSTVAIVAMQLAIWMGFEPVILIGCDMTYQASSQSEHADPDHFDPRYLDGGRSWQVPDVAGMLAHMAAAKRACDAYGVTILNATAGGRLEAFPRVSYASIF